MSTLKARAVVRPSRRDLGKAAAAMVASQAGRAAAASEMRSGIKLSVLGPPAPTDDELLFLQQLGVEYVNVAPSGDSTSGLPKLPPQYYGGIDGEYKGPGSQPKPRPTPRAVEEIVQLKKRYAEFGINVWSVSAGPSGMDAVVLNRPERDQKIEEYKQYLRTLAKAGIRNAGGWFGTGVWSSGRGTIRGAPAREFDLASPNKHAPGRGGAIHREPLAYDREYSLEEIWQNFTYFIKRVAPLAEDLGVRLSIHPADPPVAKLGGVPRLFCNFDDYRRAMDIAASPNVGIQLCCGCWLEGGRKITGKDPEEMIRYFGREKIWGIHLRNVSAPLPRFVETFPDNGYYDMYKIIKALRDVNFDGIVDPDHTPSMVGGRSVQFAYSFAYLKALLNRANAEAGT